jgi:hypothetical protein
VADITGMLDLSSWPAGMRGVVGKERPHPRAQLRFTDVNGHLFTCFATDARSGQLADLDFRHRRRTRCEDRIRRAEGTGLRSLPLKSFARNRLWCEIAAQASELLAWTQLPALIGVARRWEPKRLLLFAIAGRLACGGRRLRFAERWPWPARSPPSPACSSPFWLTSRNSNYHHGRRTRGPWTPPTRRVSRAARHDPARKITHQPTPQVGTSLQRMIAAKKRAPHRVRILSKPYPRGTLDWL